MLLDIQRLIAERQQRAWSQTQLAEVSGLSLRTIQRIEKNGKASLESVKALAAVYSLNITDIRIIESDKIPPSVQALIKTDEPKLPKKNNKSYLIFVFLAITQRSWHNMFYVKYLSIFIYDKD